MTTMDMSMNIQLITLRNLYNFLHGESTDGELDLRLSLTSFAKSNHGQFLI